MGAKFGCNFLQPAHKQVSAQGHNNNNTIKAYALAGHQVVGSKLWPNQASVVKIYHFKA